MAEKTYEIVWSDRAIADLQEIADHIAQNSPSAAEHLVDQMDETVDRLRLFPSSGRIVPELRRQRNPPRELIVANYRVVYYVREDTISIVTVFHGRRKAEDVLADLM